MNEERPTFIIVRYGDNLELVFNPWCPVYILLENIREKCQCDKEATLDLCDADGQVKNLPHHKNEYASNLVVGRQSYILIRVEHQDGGPAKYISLLSNTDDDIKGKLENLNRPQPSSRTSRRGSKWSVKNPKKIKSVSAVVSKLNK